MNRSGAASQTQANLRKTIGPAICLLCACVHGAPAKWTGDESARIARGKSSGK